MHVSTESLGTLSNRRRPPQTVTGNATFLLRRYYACTTRCDLTLP